MLQRHSGPSTLVAMVEKLLSMITLIQMQTSCLSEGVRGKRPYGTSVWNSRGDMVSVVGSCHRVREEGKQSNSIA